MRIRFFVLVAAAVVLAACNFGATAEPPLPTNTSVPTFTPTVEVVIAPVDPGAAATARAAEDAAAAATQAAANPTPAPAAAAATDTPVPAEPTATETPAPAEASVTTTSAMNVRGGPSTNYNVIGSANAGQRFPVTGKNPAGDWWQINFNGQAGWVFGQLVSQENTGGVQVAANIPAAPAAPPPANTPVPAPANTVAPAQPAATAVPSFPFLLLDTTRCDPNAGSTYFSGFARRADNSLENGVCIHVAFYGPRNTKCSGCDGVGDGNWGFSPFGGPAPAGTTVEIYVVQCPSPMPASGQSESTGFGDLTPQSPKWVKTINESTQCTGITFVRR